MYIIAIVLSLSCVCVRMGLPPPSFLPLLSKPGRISKRIAHTHFVTKDLFNLEIRQGGNIGSGGGGGSSPTS